ncbi:MAG: exodeoxyribonuclease VII large subunit [Burkholderiaceae bacterium]|nr:exodeoxyribonuclease VII large subunit [Burkholderiaceae bacterium]
MRLQRALQGLAHLDPHAVLQRGYALVTDARGALVVDAATVQNGDALALQLARGRVAVRVERVTLEPAAADEQP